MFGAVVGMSPPFEMNQSFIAAMASSNEESIQQQLGMPLSPRKFGPRKLCRICAEEATSNHFGALSCHACAAFFRRTVAFRRTYTCRHQQNCKLINVSPRRMCKYCRLARCLAIGMQPSEVRSNGMGSSILPGTILSRNDTESPSHSDQPSSSSSNAQSPNGMNQNMVAEMFNAPQDASTLTALLNSRREAIFNRNNLAMHSNNNTIPPAGNYKPAEAFALLRAMILESAVCTAFLNSSGLADYLSGKDRQTLLDQALTTWMHMDMCKFTMINNGPSTEHAFCINDQFIDINLQFIEKMYGVDKNIRSPQCIAKLMKPFYDRVLDLARLLELSKLDEYEFAALAQLTLIRIACESSDNVAETQMNMAPYVSVLTKDIHKYYNDHFTADSASVKLGTLVLLVGEMQELRQAYNKHIIMLYMHVAKEMKSDASQSEENSMSPSLSNMLLASGVGPSCMPLIKPEDLISGTNALPSGVFNILFDTLRSSNNANNNNIPASEASSSALNMAPQISLNNLFLGGAAMNPRMSPSSLASAIAGLTTTSVPTSSFRSMY